MADLFDLNSVQKAGRTLVAMRSRGRRLTLQPVGSRVRIWKQDPLVSELGARTVYLPNRILTGPADGVIRCAGSSPIPPDHEGDFLPSTVNSEAFDAVHTFAVVRMALNHYERQLGSLPWQWNHSGGNVPISVYCRAGIDKNAYYSREEKSLKFFEFYSDLLAQEIYTCRSLDIVAHETGHAVLDALQPRWIETNHPQTGGLHESFGDITSILLVLSILDLVEYVVSQTKADLHQTNALSALAEEFGRAIIRGNGRPTGLRNAFNTLTLSQVGNEVHDISQVFTGAIYRILADLFATRRDPQKRDDAETLHETGAYLGKLLVQALKSSPDEDATFADVAVALMEAADNEGDSDFAKLVKAEFVSREVLRHDGSASPNPLDGASVVSLGRCGTMHRYICGLNQSPGELELA